jgi:hypothetical protein
MSLHSVLAEAVGFLPSIVISSSPPVLEILQTTEKPLLRSLKALVRSLLV